jgi:hypothetical protein
MTMTSTRHQGGWRKLANISADRKGSIHDDEPARALGFEGALVPGSTVATAAMPSVVALLGQRWFEGGWCNFKFVTPVYTADDVREEAEATADGRIDIRVVTSDGRLCCSGQAGLGFEPPWDRAHDGRQGADLVLPGVEIGAAYHDAEMTVTPEWAANMLRAGGDSTPWYGTTSPWGRPLAPPETMHNLALQATRSRRLNVTGVKNPGMWAEHWLAVNRPIFQDQPYLFREHIADKGLSGRTAYVTYEYEVLDAGEVVAVGRHRVKWLREGEV